MKKNMSTSDRLIRTILALTIVTLFLTKTITGTLGLILLVIAVVFLLTSLIGSCPLYTVLGIKTAKEKVNP